MKNFLILYRSTGIEYISPAGARGGIAFTGANNGLSISTVTPGTVVLGQNVGQAGNPAALISAREIPLAGFSILFSGMANGPAGALIFQYAAAAVNSTEPQIIMRNHLGAQIGALRIGESNDSVYLGNNAAAGNTGIINVCVGGGAGAGQLTMTRCIAIGGGALQGNLDGLSNCIVIGNDALDNNFQPVGVNNIIIGQNAWDLGAGGAIGQGNINIGNFNNNASGATSIGDFNVILGIVNIGAISNTVCLGNFNNGANLVGLSNVVILGINTQNVLIGQTPGAFVDNGSNLQITGSIALPILVTAVGVTLTKLNYSVVFTSSGTATLPTAATSLNRIYILAAQGAAIITTSIAYTNLAGASVTTVPAGTSVMIQSNGTTWIQIK